MFTIESDFFKGNSDYALGISQLHTLLGHTVETGSNLMLICIKGDARLEIYGKKCKLRIGNILNANWEMQFKLLSVSEDFKAFYFLMSESFCNDVYRHLSPSLCDLWCMNPIMHPESNQINLLLNWIEQMIWIRNNITGQQQGFLLRNGIENLFLVCDYEAQIIFSNKSEKWIPRDWELTLKFGQLLTKYIKLEHKVSFYAEKLCVTPYYLGTITRQTLNASPKTIIDRNIIRQLKGILTTTNKTINQISDEMNFEDPSYMCKFFRKHTGMTMSEYRGHIM